jgi:hypothetical protein
MVIEARLLSYSYSPVSLSRILILSRTAAPEPKVPFFFLVRDKDEEADIFFLAGILVAGLHTQKTRVSRVWRRTAVRRREVRKNLSKMMKRRSQVWVSVSVTECVCECVCVCVCVNRTTNALHY